MKSQYSSIQEYFSSAIIETYKVIFNKKKILQPFSSSNVLLSIEYSILILFRLLLELFPKLYTP